VRKLAAPLRLTWDWAWPPIAHPGSPPRRPSPEMVRAIGAEIVRSRVLLLEVGYPDPDALRSGELAAALAGFAGSLSLVLAPDAAGELVASRPWEALGVEQVWLDATPGGAAPQHALEAWPAVRFFLTAGNLEAAAAGIERALAGGAAAISLPNLPLFGELLRGAASATPDASRLRALAGRIAAAVRDRPAVDLRVHHYGLWQALREAGVQPHGEGETGAGCQAGSALAYVDPAGVLYPCASLPVPLARVAEGAIRAAWSGAELAALRERIAALPGRCSGCPCEPACQGGCRGWAHYLHNSWDATGPDCTRP
jgi:radical SAM protein with 4Fe4S-binding SPASM domain